MVMIKFNVVRSNNYHELIRIRIKKSWGPRFNSQRESDFLFVPLRPFFFAAFAKRWNVQFRQG